MSSIDLNKFSLCAANSRCTDFTPGFYKMFEETIVSGKNKRICLVFDKHQGNTHLIAIITALSLFKKNIETMIAAYSKRMFQEGEKVIVQPQGFVYEYDGLFEITHYPALLKLKVLNSCDKRSFSPHDVLRLQKTKHKRPMGKLNTKLTVNEDTFIDSILDIKTFDNHSFIENQVVMLTTKSSFNHTCGSVKLHNFVTNESRIISQIKLCGNINISGNLVTDDTRQSGGEPLLAVSSEMEDLDAYLEKQASYSKVVFFENMSRIGSNLQAFERIVEKQFIVVFADISELNEVKQYLGDTGFKIWQLDPEDFEVMNKKKSVSENDPTHSDLLIRFPQLSSTLKSTALIDFIEVHDPIIDKLLDSFTAVTKYANQNDLLENVEDLIASLFHAIYHNISLTFYPSSDQFEKLETIRSNIKRIQTAIAPVLLSNLILCVDLCEQFQKSLTDFTYTEKGQKLRIHVNKQDYKNIVFIAKDDTEALAVEMFFKSGDENKIYCKALTFRDFKKSRLEIYDAIYLTYWPGKSKFLEIFTFSLTKNIHFSGYKIELEWYKASLFLLRKNLEQYRLTPQEKSELTGLDEKQFVKDFIDKISIDIPKNINFEYMENAEKVCDYPDHPITVFHNTYNQKKKTNVLLMNSSGEDKVAARYIEYGAGHYSWNQDSHDVHVLKNFLSHTGYKASITTKVSKNLQIRDRVLVRSNGNPSIISEMAQNIIGETKYKELCERALVWKNAFEYIGKTPRAVQVELEKNGLKKNILTIRLWMYSNTLGPSTKDDLIAIFYTAANDKLMNDMNEIWDAIEQLRSLHLKAGRQLTKEIMQSIETNIESLDLETGSFIELEQGVVEIFEVTDISEEYVQIDRIHTNRIQKLEHTFL